MPDNVSSILLDVKKLVGIDPSYDVFDTDILIHTNTAMSTLTQLGVGPETGFEVRGEEETWPDFLGEQIPLLSMVKSYVYLRVRLLFDPPVGSLIELMKSQVAELEWRISVAVDQPINETEEGLLKKRGEKLC